MAYRYETHLHTSLVSACSCFTPREIAEKYARLGYAGIFVTDHFLNGNTTVPRTFGWEARIDLFCTGYRAVKQEAKDFGLSVFFGLEYSYKGTDFLVYGLDAEWLLAHPEIMDMTLREFCAFARNEGGLVVQAHPYREADYIDHIRLFPSDVDGIETMNACRTARENFLAETLAKAYGLSQTAGADIHTRAQKTLAGMEYDKELPSERESVRRVKCGEGKIFTLADGGEI